VQAPSSKGGGDQAGSSPNGAGGTSSVNAETPTRASGKRKKGTGAGSLDKGKADKTLSSKRPRETDFSLWGRSPERENESVSTGEEFRERRSNPLKNQLPRRRKGESASIKCAGRYPGGCSKPSKIVLLKRGSSQRVPLEVPSAFPGGKKHTIRRGR